MPPRTKSIVALRLELAATEKQLAKLQAERASLAAKLAKIDRQIKTLGGEAVEAVAAPKPVRNGRTGRRGGRRPAVVAVAAKPAGKPGRKPREGAKTLSEYVTDVLGDASAPMRAKDIMTAVKKAGYKTQSKDFYGIVATALRDTRGVKRVSRGVYTTGK